MIKYKDVYISQCEDKDDKGDCVFCQVYTDENLDNEIDCFVVHNNINDIEQTKREIIKYMEGEKSCKEETK